MALGNYPETDLRRIYSMASTLLGIEAFTSIDDQESSVNTVMDSAFTDFFVAWVTEHGLKDFQREHTVLDTEEVADASVVVTYEEIAGFTHYYQVPTDLIQPLEVNFLEERRGEEIGRWQYAVMTIDHLTNNQDVYRFLATTFQAPFVVKFIFYPAVPATGDTPYTVSISPVTTKAMAYSFAEYVAPMFGKTADMARISSEARRARVAASITDAHLGSRRRGRTGDLIRVRNIGSGRGW